MYNMDIVKEKKNLGDIVKWTYVTPTGRRQVVYFNLTSIDANNRRADLVKLTIVHIQIQRVVSVFKLENGEDQRNIEESAQVAMHQTNKQLASNLEESKEARLSDEFSSNSEEEEDGITKESTLSKLLKRTLYSYRDHITPIVQADNEFFVFEEK